MKNHIRLNDRTREEVNALAKAEIRPVSAMANILIAEALTFRSITADTVKARAATTKKGAAK